MRKVKTGPDKKDEEGLSTVIGIVLVVAISVVLSSVVGYMAIGMTETQESAPRVTIEAKNLRADKPGTIDDQTIILSHRAGEKIRINETEFVVEVEKTGDRVRVKNLPVKDDFDSENIQGDEILDESLSGAAGEIDSEYRKTSSLYSDHTWEAGEIVGIRIKSGSVSLKPGDEIKITVIDQGSESVIAEKTVVATKV